MNIISLAGKEIRHRPATFLVSVLFVIATISSMVCVWNMSAASQDQVRKIMKDMGTDILILPEKTDMADYWNGRYGIQCMPEDYVKKLAAIPEINARHFIAKLQAGIKVNGADLILTGLLPEIGPVGQKLKEPMSPTIKEGDALLGYEAARLLKSKEGETIEITGRTLFVKQVKLPEGTIDDIRIFTNLKVAQQLLEKPGLINAIDALSCICLDPLTIIQQQLKKGLPDTKVILYRSIAVSRIKGRMVMEQFGLYIQILLVTLTALVIALHSFSDVSARREEIGILMAIGVSPLKIFTLFISKLLLIGLTGGAGGFLLGTWLAVYLGPAIVQAPVSPRMDLLGIALLFACLLVIVAGLIPAIKASRLDPAEILRVK